MNLIAKGRSHPHSMKHKSRVMRKHSSFRLVAINNGMGQSEWETNQTRLSADLGPFYEENVYEQPAILKLVLPL